MKARARLLAAWPCVVLGLLSAACGLGDTGAGSVTGPAPVAAARAGALTVATSVAPLASIVRNVADGLVGVRGLIPPGVDSHTFEPAPATAKALAAADIVFLNGLHLEEPLRKLADANRKPGAEIVLLGEQTIGPDQYAYDFSFPRDAGDPNPHVWMDPHHARSYARIVADTLSRRDPANRDRYQANLARFSDRIDRLDLAIRAAVASIPPANRKLVTYHDSFAYFSRRYGLPVVAAAQTASFKDPSPREVAALIDQIRRERVPAVFGSEVFPSKVLEQVARESGARYVAELRDDELPGPEGDARHTYLGMIVEDVRIVTEALGGDPSPLLAVDTTDVARGG